jgi:hypothetical protein
MHGVIYHLEEEMRWPNVLVPFDVRETISTEVAAKRAGRTQKTICNWCEADGIGRKIGAQWCVSVVALQMKLEGNRKALTLYQQGNREDPAVVVYFHRQGIGGLIEKWRCQISSARCLANHLRASH